MCVCVIGLTETNLQADCGAACAHDSDCLATYVPDGCWVCDQNSWSCRSIFKNSNVQQAKKINAKQVQPGQSKKLMTVAVKK